MTDGTWIRVLCPDWQVNAGLRWEILIDGQERGSIRRGGVLELAVEPGPHELSAVSARLGRMDVDVVTDAGEQLDVACTGNLEGLLRARAGRNTGTEDGPPPFELITDPGMVMSAEPVIDRGVRARVFLADQEAMAAQGPFWRFFSRVVMRHFVWWAVFGVAFFSWLLYHSASAKNPSVFNLALGAFFVALGLTSLVVRALMYRWSHQSGAGG